MIESVNIDIFKSTVGVISQSCNCFHTMSAGFAKHIKQLYPEAYEADCKTECGDIKKLGTISIAKIKNPALELKYIINLYSQFYYGRDKRYTDYNAMTKGFSLIYNFLKEKDLILGIPRGMGCNLAGGDWKIVESIIRAEFETSTIKVFICNKPQ